MSDVILVHGTTQSPAGFDARDRLGVRPIELAGGHNFYAAVPELVAAAIHDIM